jgi:hypothetical protein
VLEDERARKANGARRGPLVPKGALKGRVPRGALIGWVSTGALSTRALPQGHSGCFTAAWQSAGGSDGFSSISCVARFHRQKHASACYSARSATGWQVCSLCNVHQRGLERQALEAAHAHRSAPASSSARTATMHSTLHGSYTALLR